MVGSSRSKATDGNRSKTSEARKTIPTPKKKQRLEFHTREVPHVISSSKLQEQNPARPHRNENNSEEDSECATGRTRRNRISSRYQFRRRISSSSSKGNQEKRSSENEDIEINYTKESTSMPLLIPKQEKKESTRSTRLDSPLDPCIIDNPTQVDPIPDIIVKRENKTELSSLGLIYEVKVVIQDNLNAFMQQILQQISTPTVSESTVCGSTVGLPSLRRFESSMKRIICDFVNSPNVTRFRDFSADHERNPNHPHKNWRGHPPSETNVGYESASPKPGPSASLLAARTRNEASFKTPCFTELKPMLPSPLTPSTSRSADEMSEPIDNNTPRTNPSKMVKCGVCNLEMPKSKFHNHRYAEHMGLARPYGMSQEFSDTEKRQELKQTLLLMKQISCPSCLRIFISTLGFQCHQSRCSGSPTLVDCHLCGKQVAAFKAHMKIHAKEEKEQLAKQLEKMKMIFCQYCDSKYSTVLGYLYHKERCELAPQPPNTPLLKKSTRRRKEKCKVCGKKVLFLKSHMKLHTR